MSTLSRFGLVVAALLTLCLGGGSANAFVAGPALTGLSPDSLATPVAMCGVTCRNGGRYIPGPPEVCARRGLEYCGSARGGARAGGGGVGPGGGGVGGGPRGGCLP